MKRIVLLLMMAAGLTCCSKAEDIVLTFNVDGGHSRELVVVCRGEVLTASADDQGKAELVLDGVDAVYARVYYGRDSRMIYVERGDRAEVSFNGYDFDGSFRFEGDKAPVVDYLERITLVPLPDEAFGLPFDEYAAEVESKKEEAMRLLKGNRLGSVGDFEKMEAGRIRYSYGTSLLMYPIGHKFVTGDMSYEPDEEYYSYIDSYLEELPHLADLDEYLDFAVEAAHVLDPKHRNVTDLYPKTVAQMKYIADRFKNDRVRHRLLHYLAAAYVDRFGIGDIKELENIYYTYVTDESLLADYAGKREKWNISKPGRPSPEFSAPDIDGRVWTLADFRGKYVYIDLWATWCNPCRREFPFLKELEEKFRDAQIAFVGLSTDSDKDKWETMVRSGALSGLQLYLGPQSRFQKAYNVAGIPHFILLDKEGRIISNDMSRPSSEETVRTLESLEGIR